MTSKTTLLLLLVVVVVSATTMSFVAADPLATSYPYGHCAKYMSCAVCVKDGGCGWCSTPVNGPGNVSGPQCTGRGAGHNDWTCPQVYSHDHCNSGYACSLLNYTCVKTAPGTGNNLQTCEANCTSHGEVFLCNHTTKKCHQVPKGTPDATSLAVCKAACIHPSHAPSSHSPASQTYKCNEETGKCDAAKPGQGTSEAVCKSQCKKGGSYICNPISHKCLDASGNPNGIPLNECKTKCGITPSPTAPVGPPAVLLGTWRGIQINNGYKMGEFDLEVTQTLVKMVDVYNAKVIEGKPFHAVEGNNIDLWIQPNGQSQFIKVLGKTDGRGPETSFLTVAFSALGGDAPSSLKSAMTEATEKVYFFSKCAGTPECHFTMPNTQYLMERARELMAELAEDDKLVGAAESDPCTVRNANCSYCHEGPTCGWCSVPVTFHGVTYTQCAGYSTGSKAKFPWICNGQFSPKNCNTGYVCNLTLSKCVPDPVPGNGMSKETCDKICVPTPAPTPSQLYVCNITAKKCHKCLKPPCHGSFDSENACTAACIKPKPGPTPHLVVGVWRGIAIQKGYKLAERTWVFNTTHLTTYINGKEQWTGVIESFGGDVMIFVVGAKKYPATYVIDNQGGDNMYEQMTLAVGAVNGEVPQGFAPSMRSPGEYVLVMARCNGAPCKFTAP